MVAARSDFLSNEHPRSQVEFDPVPAHAFIGAWQLDRVSGLIDSRPECVQRLVVNESSLQLELRQSSAGGTPALATKLNGEMVEALWCGAKCALQALLEGEVLVWELECLAMPTWQRTRRVMRVSKQATELIVERVDTNAEGAPTALSIEYWARVDAGNAGHSQQGHSQAGHSQ